KWAVAWGLMERGTRGARPPIEDPIRQFLMSYWGIAEGLGEWAYYASVVLIALALIKYFPYRLFYKTHRLIAIAYLVLVFHSVVLMEFDYWTTPVGIFMAISMIAGTYAALVALFRRVGVARQVT